MAGPTPDSEMPLSASRYALLLGAACGLHLCLALWFAPPSVVLSSTPLRGGDYSTHAEQTFKVLEGLSGWGKAWIYDTRFLAGYPNGTVFDADNKGWELFTYALHALGLPKGLAFNLFALLVFVTLPLPLAAAAKVFGLDRRGALYVALLGTLLFFFDSLLHWLCWVGTISFVFAAYLSPLALGLFHRYVGERRTRDLVLLTPLLALIHLVHPYAFFVLAPPMLYGCVVARATLAPRDVGKLAGMCAVVIAANAYWLVPALQHFHYVLDSSYLMSADMRQVGLDFFELLSDVSTTGVIANHTAFRVLVFALCVAGLVLARGEPNLVLARGDSPTWSAARLLRATWLWLLALAYLGDHLPLLPQIQPYRFVVPAMFIALLPAGHALQHVHARVAWRTLPRAARVLAVVALVSVGQHLANEALYFFPNALPNVRWFLDNAPSPITATGYAPHPDYRLAKADPTHAALLRFADAHRDEGRIAVQDAALGEDLAARTRASILGGFWFCNLQHSYANPFRKLLEGEVSPEALRAHLQAYAVRYVVLSFPEPRIDQNRALFEDYLHVGTHRIFRSTVPIDLLAEGTGKVLAETNRITVRGSDPNADLVLRFHWHEALRCKSGCPRGIEQADNPAGRVPFIRVPAPHGSDVVLENSYTM